MTPPQPADAIGEISHHTPESHQAALAQVTTGIAPAFSDSLTVIRGQTSLLLDRCDQTQELLEPLRQILSASEKAASLLRQLQIYSGQQLAHLRPVDLNEIIAEQAAGLHQLIGDDLSLDFQLAPELPAISADLGMLEQLLIILTINAQEATPRGGSLLIQTESVKITAENISDWPAGREGEFVVIQVDDTGPGIAPEILPRIFEPFFTTKPAGRSVGLGLSTVSGIVRQHHGWLSAQNRSSGGTRFQVGLPICPADSVDPVGNTKPSSPTSEEETILVVEDDSLVREFLVTVLKEFGFRVLQAPSGPDALEVWRWHGNRIQLLLTDVVLEDGMNGLELASHLRAESPQLQVICTTGHLLETLETFPHFNSDYHHLPKPCRPQAVVNAVRTLLATQP